MVSFPRCFLQQIKPRSFQKKPPAVSRPFFGMSSLSFPKIPGASVPRRILRDALQIDQIGGWKIIQKSHEFLP